MKVYLLSPNMIRLWQTHRFSNVVIRSRDSIRPENAAKQKQFIPIVFLPLLVPDRKERHKQKFSARRLLNFR